MRTYAHTGREYDIWILGAVLALTGWGLFHLSTITMYYFVRQLWWVGAGIVLLVGFSFVRAHLWERSSYVIYVVVLIALAGVLAAGTRIHGARRWITMAGITFQPSEYAKLAAVCALARFLARTRQVTWPVVLLSLLMVLLPAALIAAEPDLGGALILAPVWLVLVFLAGASLKKLALVVGGLVALIPVGLLALHPYQRGRILTFLDPRGDPLGRGWNIRQSEIALGSGGWTGRGMGGAAHTQLRFLPNSFTDFIFSSMGEEWGFLGVLVVLGLYGFISYRGLVIARENGRSFGGLAAAGIICVFFVQVLVNVGVASGILPVTGIPLPLLSYGGNASILFLSALGVLLALKRAK